jgi:PKD repeat protein
VRLRKPIALLPALIGLFLGGCFNANTTPLASFERTPSSGEVPLSVFFNARESVDPDGDITLYQWVFGDGATATGATATHTYAAAGTYEAVLTVTDNDGAAETASRMVDVRVPGETPAVGLAVGDLAPDFTLPDLTSGEPVELASLRGYVILVDFWASTCTPCRASMPHLEALREQFAPEGLIVLAVNVDASEDAARQFLEDGGYDEFLVVRDADEAVRGLYDVAAIPHTFLIDRQGVIRLADHPIRLRAWQIEPWL